MSGPPRCPRCRQLGLSTDCSERLSHAGKDKTMNPPFDDDEYDMEVTVTFAVPVTSSLDLDPHQMATYMRERWIEEPAKFAVVLTDALSDDFDLQVRPVALL